MPGDEHDLDDPQSGERDEAPDSPEPSSGGETPEPEATERERLEGENARLRGEIRLAAADRLVDRFKLPAAYRDLLKDVPRDQQQAVAEQYAGELAEKFGTGHDPDLPEIQRSPPRSSMAAEEPEGPPATEPTPEDLLVDEIRAATNPNTIADLQRREAAKSPPGPTEEDMAAIAGANSMEELLAAQAESKGARADH